MSQKPINRTALVSLTAAAAVCTILANLVAFDPRLISLPLPQTPVLAILVIVGLFCAAGAVNAAFPPKRKQAKQAPVRTQSNTMEQSTPTQTGEDEQRGKGRPRKPCSLAQQGIIVCPLTDVTPEFPEVLVNKLASEVTKKVAINMITAFDPEKASALQAAQQAKKEATKAAEQPKPEPKGPPPKKPEETLVESLASLVEDNK
jgi:hypothetical protein